MLTARGIDSNHQKGNGDIGKSTTSNHKLEKNHYAFWKEEGYWKIDCPKLKKEKGQKSEVNFAHADEDIDSDSFVFSLSIILLFVVQRNLSGFWIRVLLIKFVLSKNGLLVLEN